MIKALVIITFITLLSYLGIVFLISLISFIYDLFTKDESQRYEEYWRDKNSDTK
jgi:hypothetical protein